MNKSTFIKRYYDMFDIYERGGITFDELVAELMLKEKIITIKEYHEILEGLENGNIDALNDTKRILKKYKALFYWYKTGHCTLNEIMLAIEILEKL